MQEKQQIYLTNRKRGKTYGNIFSNNFSSCSNGTARKDQKIEEGEQGNEKPYKGG